MLAIHTEHLSKSYGNFQSLKACNLEVREGIAFGLLGPNGAGKSTLLRTLLGFIRPSEGRAWVFGNDVLREALKARRQISYLPGDARLYRSMRGRAILDLFAGLHPFGSLENSLQVAERLDLDLNRMVMFMSTGMRQKLALSITLGCQAPLIILDEPTANLDPNVRSIVLELVKEVRTQGRTIVLSSHIFSDIDTVCDEVVILRRGVIVARQSMGQLAQHHIIHGVLCQQESRAEFEMAAQAFESCDYRSVETVGVEHRVTLHLKGEPVQWLGWLERQPLSQVSIEKAGIRSVYERFHGQEAIPSTIENKQFETALHGSIE